MPAQLYRCALELLRRVLVSQADLVALDGRNKKESPVDDSLQRTVAANQLGTNKAIKEDLAADGNLCSAVLACSVRLHPPIDLPSQEVGHDKIPNTAVLWRIPLRSPFQGVGQRHLPQSTVEVEVHLIASAAPLQDEAVPTAPVPGQPGGLEDV